MITVILLGMDMGTSQAQKLKSRKAIVDAAARLMRDRGVAAASVADVTQAAGLTHGGFYAHFDSKDALTMEAFAAALSDGRARFDKRMARTKIASNFEALLDIYLAPEHRDLQANGCAIATLSPDMRHASRAVREQYAKGLTVFVTWVATMIDAPSDEARMDQAYAVTSALAGAIVLARATADRKQSDAILAATRALLSASVRAKR